MTCSECKTHIDNWLDKQLALEYSCTDKVTMDQEALDHITHCQSCARLFETARMIAGTSNHIHAVDVHYPETLTDAVTDSVMAKIQDHASNKRKSLPLRPSSFTRYILVAAILAVALIPFIGRLGHNSVTQEYTETEMAEVILQFEAPQAQTVVVVGDWNNWDPQAQHLAKEARDGTWTISMKLQRGKEYRYQFVIDGESWQPDPHAYMQVDDGFGGKNSILEM